MRLLHGITTGIDFICQKVDLLQSIQLSYFRFFNLKYPFTIDYPPFKQINPPDHSISVSKFEALNTG